MGGIRRKLLKILSLFVIFSMLSNYIFVCSEIADVALATEFEARETSSLELNTEENSDEMLNEEAEENLGVETDNFDEEIIESEEPENVAGEDEEPLEIIAKLYVHASALFLGDTSSDS